jgi:hypothetical protein
LIADIDRVVQIIESDIVAEEEQAGVFNRSQAEYPMPARALAARRDNLRDTITALEQRLADLAVMAVPIQASRHRPTSGQLIQLGQERMSSIKQISTDCWTNGIF